MVSISSYWLKSTELSILNNKKLEVTFVKCSKLLFDKIYHFQQMNLSFNVLQVQISLKRLWVVHILALDEMIKAPIIEILIIYYGIIKSWNINCSGFHIILLRAILNNKVKC